MRLHGTLHIGAATALIYVNSTRSRRLSGDDFKNHSKVSSGLCQLQIVAPLDAAGEQARGLKIMSQIDKIVRFAPPRINRRGSKSLPVNKECA
ncbi:hypothetical protein [Devosia riboflavina]|uniref:hypothetical protein n=1 Tax=Devosia riboflavina TaxID=46914 RepID=UPI001269F202|nr:hypothetical protein [Devosia riboflavina]